MSACDACKELDSSEQFVDVLQYILAIGNFLNSKNKKGGAYGFKLSSLAKVGDRKGKGHRVQRS